jgi:Recombinase
MSFRATRRHCAGCRVSRASVDLSQASATRAVRRDRHLVRGASAIGRDRLTTEERLSDIGAKLTVKARQKGADANAEAAAARAADLAPVITELQASGATSLRAIASALNDRGIPTARGGKWLAASVRDVLARI